MGHYINRSRFLKLEVLQNQKMMMKCWRKDAFGKFCWHSFSHLIPTILTNLLFFSTFYAFLLCVRILCVGEEGHNDACSWRRIDFKTFTKKKMWHSYLTLTLSLTTWRLLLPAVGQVSHYYHLQQLPDNNYQGFFNRDSFSISPPFKHSSIAGYHHRFNEE